MSRKLQKVTARVFSATKDGGNPVTIFYSQNFVLEKNLQKSLAQKCEWESVHISSPDVGWPRLHFFLPSGEEVSFCAHAAIGAIKVASSGSIQVTYETNYSSSQKALIDGDEVGLKMSSAFLTKSLEKDSLSSLLEQTNIDKQGILTESLNASIARPKTLIELASVDALNTAIPPSNPDTFRQACDAIGSTGLYPYARISNDTWECRQFPRASGYPEDPATGIAASALAVHLHRDLQLPVYNIYQGTAMGRPSLIRIKAIHLKKDASVSFECWGRVDIDGIEEMSI
jgi:PhzF family phenazine biosynthesis protein